MRFAPLGLTYTVLLSVVLGATPAGLTRASLQAAGPHAAPQGAGSAPNPAHLKPSAGEIPTPAVDGSTGAQVAGEASVHFMTSSKCTELVVKEIELAKRSVLLCAIGCSSPRLCDALLKAKARGVQVHVVVDALRPVTEGIQPKLTGATTSCVFDRSHSGVRGSYAVIDNALVAYGAFDFTDAIVPTDDASLMVARTNASLAAAFMRDFQSHVGHSQPLGIGLARKAGPAHVAAGSEEPPAVLYETKIETDSDNVLKLENGAIIEITHGYLGYVGYRKDAWLWRSGHTWKVYVDGKRAFSCEVLRAPLAIARSTVEEVDVTDMKGNGSIVAMLDGSLWEVESIDEITTDLWLPPFEALLVDGSRLFNLDEGEVASITRLR